uniref:Anaphase-promoting complex subunit 13 n=1 Tax=Junco hyemalis TaxID=40217 RepID=A0A8C5JPE7_JUNHY
MDCIKTSYGLHSPDCSSLAGDIVKTASALCHRFSCSPPHAVTMDSEVQRDGRILDLIDDAWREDKLPYEDVAIPLNELPEPEQDNGGTTESVKEQEMKWTDLALQYLHENVPPTGN